MNPISSLLRRRLDSWSVEPPNQTIGELQRPIWNLLCDYYFRLEVDGWESLPTVNLQPEVVVAEQVPDRSLQFADGLVRWLDGPAVEAPSQQRTDRVHQRSADV